MLVLRHAYSLCRSISPNADIVCISRLCLVRSRQRLKPAVIHKTYLCYIFRSTVAFSHHSRSPTAPARAHALLPSRAERSTVAQFSALSFQAVLGAARLALSLLPPKIIQHPINSPNSLLEQLPLFGRKCNALARLHLATALVKVVLGVSFASSHPNLAIYTQRKAR